MHRVSTRTATPGGLHDWVSAFFRSVGGTPCFQVYGKGRAERQYHLIDIYATDRRNHTSSWPLFRGTCITWTANIIAVGWDYAATLVREQACDPATRDRPVIVQGGQLRDCPQRREAGASGWISASELMAHECGHTAQARRMGGLYWLIGALTTQFREGDRFWNRFENQASQQGIFGGIVAGSVCARLRAETAESRG